MKRIIHDFRREENKSTFLLSLSFCIFVATILYSRHLISVMQHPNIEDVLDPYNDIPGIPRHHIPRKRLLIQLGQLTLVVDLYVGFTSKGKSRIGFGHMGGLKKPAWLLKMSSQLLMLVDLPILERGDLKNIAVRKNDQM